MPAPYNTDALAATVQGAVRSAVQEMQTQAAQQAQQQQAQQRQQQAAAQQWSDPVAQTVRPYIEPVVQALNLQVQAANDKSDFYMTYPEAAGYRQDVESMFQQLMQQGRPMEREAVWHYYKGKNAAAFSERDAQKAKEDLEASTSRFATVGGPSAQRPTGPNMDQFRSLPLEAQRDALKGISF